MTDLLKFAERCEKVTGPDRRLDAEIDIAIRGFPERAYHQTNGLRGKGSPDIDRIEWFIKWGATPYTSSLDAAMTLVPEGRCWKAICWPKNTAGPCGGATIEGAPDALAATPALALCAAALRARAA